MTQVETMMQEWLRHRNVLEKVLMTLKDADMTFKPWEGAMTLGQLPVHIAYWSRAFVTLVKVGDAEFSQLIAAEPKGNSYRTFDDVYQTVQAWTEETKAAYAALSDEDLEVENQSKIPNFNGPRKMFLTLMHDHEVHHKGQLFVYARMVGVQELPFFC
ncbi:putative damage-inducible protein DinB [Pullulanibacillus pueri]|uniref:Damage-inducible protein DinB n=1 Tax=Pullulanibacillus pueri TaxID=1437324 RepID=A0A8J2ZTM6_9BACL|nr:DinB family protein [Pullulanibacillus pueri]MBM7681306.1 putative damage-inducible protein DinB [Pullulanibacillus pueri]GGH77659.1 hypothetical protein GCM10007096_09880 [Pullulanibacillus pueri]